MQPKRLYARNGWIRKEFRPLLGTLISVFLIYGMAHGAEFSEIGLSSMVDEDGDEYYRSLVVEADVTAPASEQVYFEVWNGDILDRRLLGTSAVFTADTETGNYHPVPLNADTCNLPHGLYDLAVKLYKSDGTLVQTWDAWTDSDLYRVPMEKSEQDHNHWTLMVYMMGDKDSGMSGYVDPDINRLESVDLQGSAVTVLADYNGDGGQKGTRRGRIVHDADSSSINSPLVWLNEMDMGRADTLRDFISWSAKTCPADNYALIMWDHGHGLDGVGSGTETLSPLEIRTGIADSGVKLELVSFDACLMAMTEVAYELRGQAVYMTGSEALIPKDPGFPFEVGFPYAAVLQTLNSSPHMNSASLAATAINSYRGEDLAGWTYSAIYLAGMEALGTALDNLGGVVRRDLSGRDWETIHSIIDDLVDYDAALSKHNYRDLGEFLDRFDLESNGLPTSVRNAARLARTALNKAVIANRTSPLLTTGQGLSIYLPKLAASYGNYDRSHFELLNKAPHWLGFVRILENLPEIAISGNNVEILNSDDTADAIDGTDFGVVIVGGKSSTHTFRILNTGAGQLGLTGNPKVEITGANPADFMVTLQPDSLVGPFGSSTVFQMDFRPIAAGARRARASIANSDDASNPFVFSVQGTGNAPVGNSSPQVYAGPDISVRGTAWAQLTGVVTDDGLPNPPARTTEVWKQVSGPGTVTFADPLALNTTASFSAAGTYELQLSASDGELSASDTITVVVSAAANLAPQVEAGPDQTAMINIFTATVTLTGGVSDDGMPNPPGAISCLWSKVSGPGNVVFSPANAAVTKVSLDAVGNYVLRLAASDGQLEADDTVSVAVNAKPQQKITAIAPSWGPNNGSTHITELAGDGFLAGTRVKLVTPGRPDIEGMNVVVLSGSRITCDFNLLGAAAGKRDVAVTFPDGKLATLLSGFTVGDVIDGGAEPCIAVSSNGTVHIAYIQDNLASGNSSYLKYTRIADSAWATDIVATSPAEESYAYPWIGLDGSGKPHLGWVELYANGRVLHGSKGGSWSVETVDTGTATDLTCGFDGMAMAMYGSVLDFVYEKRTSGAGGTIKDGFRWGRKSGSWTYGSLNSDFFNGSVAATTDASGNTHILYLIDQDIRYRQRTAAGWQGEQTVQAGVGAWYHGRPGLAVDSLGNVHAVYAGGRDGNKPRYAKRAGGVWSASGVIDSSANCDGGFARIACAPDGTLHAAYYSGGLLKQATNHGDGWQIRNLDTMDEWGGPDIAVDPQSVVHLAYGKNNKLAYLRVPPYQQLTLALTPAGGGTTVPAPGVYFYERGATASLMAVASRGWVFDGWSGDAQGTNASLLVTNDTDKVITANFRLRRILTDVPDVNVPEGGEASFRVKLSAPPETGLVVSVTRWDGDTHVMVQSGATLRFDTNNWDVYQTVVLSSPTDADAEDGQTGIKCVSSDGSDAVVEAFHRDAQFHSILTDIDATTMAEGGTSSIRVRLSNQPETDLSVSVSLIGPTNMVLQSGAALSFTRANWNTYQTVTMAALPDANSVNDQAILRCGAAGWTGKDVSVTELDNEMPLVNAPVIASQPTNATVTSGSMVCFAVAVSGTAPFSYQWRKDGAAIQDATNASLILANAQLSDAGNYLVVVSNSAGAISSQAALLVVSPPWLAAHYPMDDSGPDHTVADTSGKRHGLMNTNTAARSILGSAGKALHFNGIDDCVKAAGIAWGTNDFSISVWVEPEDYQQGGVISQGGYCFERGWLLDYNAVGRGTVRFETGLDGAPNGTLETGLNALIPDGQWHHLLASVDRVGPSRLFIDGRLCALGQLGAGDLNNTNLIIGGLHGGRCGGLTPFKGGIDDVQIYACALAAAEADFLLKHPGEILEQTHLSPVISIQPQPQKAALGSDVALEVSAQGEGTLRYQWTKNGTMISGATEARLILTRVQLSDAGVYAVLLSDEVRTIQSDPAKLEVYWPPSESPVAYYPLDDNAADTVVAELMGTHPGTMSAATQSRSVAGVAGLALDFNGTSDHIRAVGPDVHSGDFSVSVWIKPKAFRQGGIVSEGGYTWEQGWFIDFNAGGPGSVRLETDIDGNGNGTLTTGTNAVPLDERWHHIAASVDRVGTSRLLIDGVMKASGKIGPGDLSNTNLVIGGLNGARGGGLMPFTGSLDEVQLYNRALTDDEIVYLQSHPGAMITGGHLAPMITSQPTSQTVTAAANVVIRVLAQGSAPLFYQWQKDGAAMANATNSALVWESVPESATGDYRVVVSNSAGSVASAAARLTVIAASTGTRPEFAWIQTGGGSGDDAGSGVAVDAQGNCFVVGCFTGVATFGVMSATSAGGNDVFVAKYTKDGIPEWVRRAGGSGNDGGNKVAVDASGNCLVVGGFSGVATFGDIVLTSAGDLDMFVAKYSPAGDLLWVRSAGGAGYDEGSGVATDPWGNCYLSGTFTGNARFGKTELVGRGGSDIFVAKYNAAGELQWVVSGGGPGDDAGTAIAADSVGNCYVTGYFWGDAIFGKTALPGAGTRDFVLAKYDPQGGLLWAKRGGGSNYDLGLGVAVDSAGNCYVTGEFSSQPGVFETSQLNCAGPNDIFVAKYSGTGTLEWIRQAGAEGPDFGWGIAVDAAGNSYVTGFFWYSVDFGTNRLTSAGIDDVFVARYDGDGQPSWAVRAGGANYDYGRSVAVDSSGNCFVTGFFYGPATFDTLQVSSIGQSKDVFVAKLSVHHRPPSITQQPASQTVDPGQSATFTVGAAGTPPLAYQWRKEGMDIAGATNGSLILSNVQTNEAGDYCVKVSNAAGSVLSATARLEVRAGAVSQTNPKDGADMIWVPAGEFTMGFSAEEIDAFMRDYPAPEASGGSWDLQWFAADQPRHAVYLDGYWIYRNEVTVAQYRKFCQETGRAMPPAPGWGWPDQYPVVNVTWDDAAAYALWAGARLPSEAEWEKAARGTDARRFPWGDTWDLSKCRGSQWFWAQASHPTDVGSYPLGASPYGVLDLAGNVYEFCADWYATNYYAVSPRRNPLGPAAGQPQPVPAGGWPDPVSANPDGTAHVVRGGAWDQSAFVTFACAHREWLRLLNSVGFRCAQSVTNETPTVPLTLSIGISGGYAALTIKGNIGSAIQVEYRTDFTSGSKWTPMILIKASGTPVQFTDTSSPGLTQRYYRVVSYP